MNSEEMVNEAIKKSGEPFNEKLKTIMIRIVEASLRSGYNQAVKDHRSGIPLVEKDMSMFGDKK